ncbi:MAG: GGDEF domain-containing protein [Candidatus Omnitrophica bacterium]|nr:GGDEF domain-containing protein [Candidatus Omnitrophota bacterium]
MGGKKIIVLTEILLAFIFTIVLFYTYAFFEPLLPLKVLIKKMLPSLLLTLFFLFLCFRIIEYYNLQILSQNKLNENLNSFIFKLSSDLKIENLLQNSLQILLEFYKGNIGVLIIISDDLKKFVSTDVITINISNITHDFKTKKNYVYITFPPHKILQDEKKKIEKIINDYRLNNCEGIIIIPILSEKQLKGIGIIGINNKKRKEILKEFERTKLAVDVFMQHLALELENSLLHEKLNYTSITDPLTESYNRRYFNKRVKEEFARARREGYPVSIMISDLDNFKKYVDSFGHPMGDIILKEFANLLRVSMRETDIFCRFGGDEFAYLLPFASSSEAKIVAERIKNNVENYKFLKDIVDEDVKITLSLGVASFPEHGNSEDEILSKADNALFKAKSMGKNRVVIWEEKGGEND